MMSAPKTGNAGERFRVFLLTYQEGPASILVQLKTDVSRAQ